MSERMTRRAGGADRAARAGAADHAQPARGDERDQRRAVARSVAAVERARRRRRSDRRGADGRRTRVLRRHGPEGVRARRGHRADDDSSSATAPQKPLIGAIEGFALAGGLELALTCDLLVAAKGAKLGIPEASVGLFAAAGGLVRLPSRVGYGKAMEMAITADPITAEEAFELGLVARLADRARRSTMAMELAERVARNAPLAVAASKQLMRRSQGVTEDEFWELQRPFSAKVFTSNDAKEGPRAFAEKRPPEWTGT